MNQIPLWLKGHLWQASIMCLVAAVVYLLFGCVAAVDYSSFDSMLRPRTNDITIFRDPSLIERKYTEIGLVSARSGFWQESESRLLELIKQKAKRMGADALILESVEQSRKYYLNFSRRLDSRPERIMRATAIVYSK